MPKPVFGGWPANEAKNNMKVYKPPKTQNIDNNLFITVFLY